MIDHIFATFSHLYWFAYLTSKEQDVAEPPEPTTSPPAAPASGASSEYTDDSGRGSQVSEVITGEMLDKIMKQSGVAIDIFGQDMVSV